MDLIILVLLTIILVITISNNIKINTMGENLKEIKQALADADAKADKVAADVKKLHDLIAATGETPSAEEWQEVKDAAAALNAKLQGIDDSTPE